MSSVVSDTGDLYDTGDELVVVGICGLERKVRSGPMKEILDRLNVYNEFSFVYMLEDTIELPVEEWPECDVFISLVSSGFQLQQALEYVKQRDVFCINDVSMAALLLDRVKVYERLRMYNVRTPRYIYVKDTSGPDDVVETDEYVEIDGERMYKPFVEKPVDAQDHNVVIYYSPQQGGGCRKLFRKIGDKSSEFLPEQNQVRRDQRYLYEEFLPTVNAMDIKVYTVGLDYAHAEARKSPVVDGIVERREDGKEQRRIVNMTTDEKELCRRVVVAFRQVICGFDILRSGNMSYVCDVNGWSFVKSIPSYYDKCSERLRKIFLYRRLWLRGSHETVHRPESVLKGFALICRHADRTPKEKLKLKTTRPQIVQFFNDVLARSESKKREFKLMLRHNEDVPEVMSLIEMIQEIEAQAAAEENSPPQSQSAKDLSGLTQLRMVLANRYPGVKVQMKESKPGEILVIGKWGGQLTHAGEHEARDFGALLREILLAEAGNNMDLFINNMRIFSTDESRVIRTAENFVMGFKGETCNFVSTDSVHVDKTLNDVSAAKARMDRMKAKIGEIMLSEKEYKDDDAPTKEGQAYRRGTHLYDIDSSTYTQHDEDHLVAKLGMGRIGTPRAAMERLHTLIAEYYEHLQKTLAMRRLIAISPTTSQSALAVPSALTLAGPLDRAASLLTIPSPMSPSGSCHSIEDDKCDIEVCVSETPELMLKRWEKMLNDFRIVKSDGSVTFNVSKINDLYDSARHDMLHNHCLFANHIELYKLSKVLTDFIVPSEYGIYLSDKLKIGFTICNPLMQRVVGDLEEMRAPFRVASVERARYYFTSESQLHATLNTLMFERLPGRAPLECNQLYCLGQSRRYDPFELNFLTHILFCLYEDTTRPLSDPLRFYVKVEISPGLFNVEDMPTMFYYRSHVLPIQPLRLLYARLPLSALGFVRNTDRDWKEFALKDPATGPQPT